jgi:hypothetical protein
LKNSELRIFRFNASVSEKLRKAIAKMDFLAKGSFVFLANNTAI